MRTRLTAYNVSFEEDENFLLDDIESYLENLESETLLADYFQYLPMELYQTIKIPINQQYILPLLVNTPFPFNYLKVLPLRGGDEEALRGGSTYYFIKGARWISRECIELELKLDTLNTLGTPSKGYYSIDKKTLILREHKKRYRNVGSSKYFKIDKVSEGLNPKLYNTNKIALFHEITSPILHNFYLIYMNSLDDPTLPNNAIRAYLTFDNINNNMKEVNTLYPGFTSPLTPAQFNEGVYYYLVKENSDLSITYTPIGGSSRTINITTNFYVEMYYDNGKIKVLVEGPNVYKDETYSISITATNQPLHFGNKISTLHLMSTRISKIKEMPYEEIGSATSRSGIILPMNQVDRTNPQIIKILKLPYTPRGEFIYNPVDNSIIFSTEDYSYDSARQLLYINDLNNIFNSKVKGYKLHGANANELINLNPNSLRSINNEPKLYHSDFYYKKLLYDSFSLMIRGEFLTHNAFVARNPYINFYATTTLNTRFIFSIDESNGDIFEGSEEDYPNTLSINRNNEVILYNNEYMNYIKNGYNYEKKKQERAESFGLISNALGIAGAIAGGVVGGNFGASTSVNLASSTGRGVIGQINQHIEYESSMEQKLKLLQNQATSVNGSDDVDLLEVYNKNKLWLYTYEVSEEMKLLLYDLFYYNGYRCNYRGIPNLNSRYWFNYIQCELNISDIKSFVPSEVITDLKSKYYQGITIHHKHSGEYNLEQTKENWESDLIE